MNPTSASMPVPAVPTPAAVPAAPVQAATNVETNIPVHTQQVQAEPVNEAAEFDKIMHDVGRQLKKEDVKPAKHGMLGFLHHEPKPLVKVNNQAPRPSPVTVQAAPSIAHPVPVVAVSPSAPMQPAQAQPQPKAASKPKVQHHIPVFVIFVALCVTGFLVAAAIAAYRPT